MVSGPHTLLEFIPADVNLVLVGDWPLWNSQPLWPELYTHTTCVWRQKHRAALQLLQVANASIPSRAG
jgi:hypothetical protein